MENNIFSIVCSLIALIGVIAMSIVNYLQNKRSAVFEAYFYSKVNAYKDFWNAIAKVRQIGDSKENRSELVSKTMGLALFSNSHTYEVADKLCSIILQYPISSVVPVIDDTAKELVSLMKEELKDHPNGWKG